MKKISLLFVISTVVVAGAIAQNPKVQFNGVARGNIENSWLPPGDTTNIDQKNKGNVLLDLGMNIKPNEFMRINTTLRFTNEFGGFWGQGAAIKLRNISMKGVAGKFFKYQLGDIDMQMTPYTFYNSDGDANVNEAEVFKTMRDLPEEENFNNLNSWRQQGAHVISRLGFDKGIKYTDIEGFIVRNRYSSQSLFPDRLQAGARAVFNITDKSFVGFNYVNLFDVPGTLPRDSVEKLQNQVATANFNVDVKLFYLFGEAGYSGLKNQDSTGAATTDITGELFDMGLGRKLFNDQFTIEASYRYVSDDFYSSAAQSKRLDYTATPALLSSVTNTTYTRGIGLIDILRDETIYNQKINAGLMAYDPRYNNVTPYGKATPNRKGYTGNLAYKDSTDRFATGVSAEILTDARGEGTESLRNYNLVRWYGNLNIHRIFNLKKTLALNGGFLYTTTTRKETTTIKVPDVDFKTQTLDLGAEIELLKRFDLLLGTKMNVANGLDYLSVRDEFNQVTDFTKYDIDDAQNIYSAAFRYRFNDNITLKLQGNYYEYKDKMNSANNFDIKQVFLLFNMRF